MRTEYAIPMMIEADKRICLKSGGNALNSETICTTFGDAALLDPDVVTWTRPIDGKPYVILGQGEFQYQEVIGGPFYVRSTSGPNNIDLFKGSRLYNAFNGGSITLNSAFFGRQVGSDGTLTIATTSVNLVSLPVRVSTALIGTTATPVNRSIENFITQASVNAFLTSIRASSSLNPQTNLRNDREPVGMTTFQNRQTGDKIVKSLAELETLSVNGNKNILALKGNLTIVGCSSNTFLME